MAQLVQRLVAEVTSGEDALGRARLATQYIDLLGQARRAVAHARMEAIGELRETTNMSKRAIARELSVTENVIRQADLERRGYPRRVEQRS